jgi:hypothetical protein
MPRPRVSAIATVTLSLATIAKYQFRTSQGAIEGSTLPFLAMLRSAFVKSIPFVYAAAWLAAAKSVHCWARPAAIKGLLDCTRKPTPGAPD